MPQLALLFWTSVQTPPQGRCPCARQVQTPDVQLWPVPQDVSQFPQCMTSELKSTHACPHAVRLGSHAAAQPPRLQKSSGEQAMPQSPQFAGLD
jgi:hypothetical protein